jgi:hypothetical protein
MLRYFSAQSRVKRVATTRVTCVDNEGEYKQISIDNPGRIHECDRYVNDIMHVFISSVYLSPVCGIKRHVRSFPFQILRQSQPRLQLILIRIMVSLSSFLLNKFLIHRHIG